MNTTLTYTLLLFHLTDKKILIEGPIITSFYVNLPY